MSFSAPPRAPSEPDLAVVSPAVAPALAPSVQPAIEAMPGAGQALAILTAINLLNYLDRYVPSAVKDLYKEDLGLTDAQTSLPLSGFVFVYMVMSPVFGALSERFPRKLMIAAGVALWSLATAAAAWSHSFVSFLLARALVGVGEAAYATLSPPLLSDFYPPHRRNRVLTRFFVAIPVGSALGFALGGFLGARWGWRAAFLFCGLPGLLAALATLTIQEPPRGALDDRRTEAATMAWPQALKSLSKNREYAWSVAGYTAVTFASGALADWFPAFLVRHRGMALEEAGSLVGAAAVLGGLGGTVVGGYLGDRLKGWVRQPYYAVSALSMALASVLAAVALLVTSKAGVAVTMILAQFFMWFYNGPINARIVNAVPSALRARALSLSILCIHLLGDALSPTVVGLVADAVGLPLGIACVPLAMAVGAGLWGHAWKTLPEEGV